MKGARQEIRTVVDVDLQVLEALVHVGVVEVHLLLEHVDLRERNQERNDQYE